ncbi:hypothetical protein FA09DRAFT_158959 [Tilletiopsis washingtonensis]|jgi:hypothetical protein|uniref:Uncharacterized protein n=1 Tax=Tilletiopsis washingtonensis TaxID=58919 RepID=A0A316Z031_9BASI|nr:hypothetical protein FA09DRAFT_158959 [Tilletiopsis washingtonensis]PWN95067.1 hypothetical protein FA09DRAFT_158959 [Tilletiopsis washingtonensis]
MPPRGWGAFCSAPRRSLLSTICEPAPRVGDPFAAAAGTGQHRRCLGPRAHRPTARSIGRHEGGATRRRCRFNLVARPPERLLRLLLCLLGERVARCSRCQRNSAAYGSALASGPRPRRRRPRTRRYCDRAISQRRSSRSPALGRHPSRNKPPSCRRVRMAAPSRLRARLTGGNGASACAVLAGRACCCSGHSSTQRRTPQCCIWQAHDDEK